MIVSGKDRRNLNGPVGSNFDKISMIRDIP